MTFTAKLDEYGRLTLPLELRDRLGPNAEVEIEVREDMVRLTKLEPGLDASTEDRAQRIQNAFARLRPAMREAFVAEGWKSVDEYIDDMRGR
jgi:bifunctional DNA-binding transcriptional regulator/antitoxin component of YhaV-PrlF toxin-antitoxin module